MKAMIRDKQQSILRLGMGAVDGVKGGRVKRQAVPPVCMYVFYSVLDSNSM